MNTSTGRGSDLDRDLRSHDAELGRLHERIDDLEYRQWILMERVMEFIKGHSAVQTLTAPTKPALSPNRLPGFD